MSRRTQPEAFATYSYYLAIASVGILLLYGLLGVLGIMGGVLSQFVWVVFITSGVGAFFAFAARSDFRRHGPSEATLRRARVGWRVNLGALAFMLLFALVFIAVMLLPGISL